MNFLSKMKPTPGVWWRAAIAAAVICPFLAYVIVRDLHQKKEQEAFRVTIRFVGAKIPTPGAPIRSRKSTPKDNFTVGTDAEIAAYLVKYSSRYIGAGLFEICNYGGVDLHRYSFRLFGRKKDRSTWSPAAVLAFSSDLIVKADSCAEIVFSNMRFSDEQPDIYRVQNVNVVWANGIEKNIFVLE